MPLIAQTTASFTTKTTIGNVPPKMNQAFAYIDTPAEH